MRRRRFARPIDVMAGGSPLSVEALAFRIALVLDNGGCE
jgi:hypothetical protein